MKEKRDTMTPGNELQARLQQHYERLWSEGIRRIRTGTVELDDVLQARKPDQRRGLSVIARPTLEIRRRVAAFLAQLRLCEPDQHYYLPSNLHLTVLSLFTATEFHKSFSARMGAYKAAVDAALRHRSSFEIEFSGITVSPGTVMIQGMFGPDGLNELREALRHELRIRRLTQGLDGRYRLETAHMTVVRFRAALRDSNGFAQTLETARDRRFGRQNVSRLSLVQNNWYMTRRLVKTLARYNLSVRRAAECAIQPRA